MTKVTTRTLTAAAAAIVLWTWGSPAAAQAEGQKPGTGEGASASSAAVPRPSLDETLTGAAKAEYDAGKVLYRDGDHAGALLKFTKAYELSKDPRLLWNMAAMEKNLRRYAAVLDRIDRFVEESGAALTDEDRERVAQLKETMKGFVTELTVVVSEPDAEILLNGTLIGRSPLPSAVRTEMGVVKLRVSKPGFYPSDTEHTLPGGEPFEAKIDLQPVPKEGTLRVVADHGDAIRVDGKLVGTGRWEGRLAAGAHTVEVTGKAKRPHRGDVVVEVGQATSLDIRLEPMVKAAPRRDEPSSPWPWIGGGVLLAGGVIAAALLLQPSDEEPPSPVGGNLGVHFLSF